MPIKIAIDLTALVPEPTGCDTYMRQLVRYLGRVDRSNRYDIYVNAGDGPGVAGGLPSNFSVISACFGNRPSRLLFQQLALPLAAVARGADVVHSPSFLSPLLRLGRKQVLTVHDMTFFTMPDYHIALRRSAAFKWLVLHGIRTSDAVLVPSEATAAQMEGRTHLIPYGIGEEFFLRAPDPARRPVPHPYILAVGTIEPRKNLGRLIDAYRHLVIEGGIEEHLVLAGRLGWNYEDILKKLEAPELQGRVHRPGFVSAADLPWYYAGARLCVYPSIAEGFGFPPLEAMASGVPVISSLSTSLTENLDGAAELVAPDDTDGLARAMSSILRDPARHAALREAGLARAARYSWSETARRTVAVYEAVAAGQPAPDSACGSR